MQKRDELIPIYVAWKLGATIQCRWLYVPAFIESDDKEFYTSWDDHPKYVSGKSEGEVMLHSIITGEPPQGADAISRQEMEEIYGLVRYRIKPKESSNE